MKICKTIVVALCAFFIFGCAAKPPAPSPTDTLKTFIEASKNKDAETVKKTLSKGTIGMIEETAKAQNTTVDDLLKKDNGMTVKELPEMRNEKIEGDTATLEVKNVVTGDFDSIPFVKEDGGWKIALDKFMQQLMKKSREQMTMPPVNNESQTTAPKPDGDIKPKEAPDKTKANK